MEITAARRLSTSCEKRWVGRLVLFITFFLLPCHPTRLVCHRCSGASEGRLRQGGACSCRKAVWPRPCFRAGTQPNAPQIFPRIGNFPDRSLPRQGTGPESALLPLRQFFPRANLEQQLY